MTSVATPLHVSSQKAKDAYHQELRARSEWFAAREAFDAALRRAYESGATMRDLATLLDISYERVRTALIRAGADLRHRGPRRNKGRPRQDG